MLTPESSPVADGAGADDAGALSIGAEYSGTLLDGLPAGVTDESGAESVVVFG